MDTNRLLRRIRLMLIIFVVLLLLGGITAFATYTELKWLVSLHLFPERSAMGAWLNEVWLSLKDTNDHHPLLFYGYD
jgi:hypothetical protein